MYHRPVALHRRLVVDQIQYFCRSGYSWTLSPAPKNWSQYVKVLRTPWVARAMPVTNVVDRINEYLRSR